MGIFSSYKKRTDEELYILFVGGNNKAFEQLYTRYSKRILHFMFKMLNNDEEQAQDFLQDIFMKIVERPELFDTSKSFKSWVFMVAANKCKNEYRKSKLIEVDADTVMLNDHEADYKSLLAQIDSEVFKKQLKIELNRLSQEHKTVFILRFKEQFTVKEIADITECSEGTVKSRIHYGVKKLAKKLEMFHPQKIG